MVAVAGLYVVALSRGFSGFPSGDDYPAIFPIACQVAEHGWASVRWENLQEQHFSHRIVPVRLITLLQMALGGQVILPVFQWVGVVAWAVAFLILWRCAGAGLGPGAGLAAALIWFQPQAADNSLVPMQAQNLLAILAALTALAWRARGGRGSTPGAWLLAGVCLFTSGNGVVVLAVLGLWELAERRWRAAVGGAAWTLFLLTAYFHGFVNPDRQEYRLAPLEILGNALAMVGATVKLGPGAVPAAVMAGLAIALISLWAAGQAWQRGDRFWLATYLFVLGTVGLAAVSRVGWGFDFMMTERYRTYPLLLLFLVWVQAAHSARGIRIRRATLAVAATGFALASWWHYGPSIPNARRAGLAQAASWERGFPGVFQSEGKVRAAAVEILERALRLGVYRLPPTGLIAEAAEETAVTARWHIASRGYLLEGTERTAGPAWAWFSSAAWSQVAFRPFPRFALGRWLRGENQPILPMVLAGGPGEIPEEIQGRRVGLAEKKQGAGF